MRKIRPFDAAKEATRHGKETGKSGHPLFGRVKGTVTIPKGVDLTEPACPEWADLIDEIMPLPREDKESSS
jgi:hypothetical protein